jgi:hypothetical protein
VAVDGAEILTAGSGCGTLAVNGTAIVDLGASPTRFIMRLRGDGTPAGAFVLAGAATTVDLVATPSRHVFVFESTGIAVYTGGGVSFTRFALPPELTLSAASLGSDGAIWIGGNVQAAAQLGSLPITYSQFGGPSLWLASLTGVLVP